MEAKPQREPVQEEQIRAVLDQHWAASDANDFETEHLIYHEDAVLEYPQSGERTGGRRNIQGQRASQPNKKRFSIRRIFFCFVPILQNIRDGLIDDRQEQPFCSLCADLVGLAQHCCTSWFIIYIGYIDLPNKQA